MLAQAFFSLALGQVAMWVVLFILGQKVRRLEAAPQRERIKGRYEK